jgi:hypothetical protein
MALVSCCSSVTKVFPVFSFSFLRVGEEHGTTKGKKLFIDMLTDVDEIFHAVLEHVGNIAMHASHEVFTDNAVVLAHRLLNFFPYLEKDQTRLRELTQVTLSMYEAFRDKKLYDLHA